MFLCSVYYFIHDGKRLLVEEVGRWFVYPVNYQASRRHIFKPPRNFKAVQPGNQTDTLLSQNWACVQALTGGSSCKSLHAGPILWQQGISSIPQKVCFSVQRVRGSIPGLGRLVKITICCVEPPLRVTLSPAGSLANSCYPATWGRPVWRRQPFANRVAIPPFFNKTMSKCIKLSSLQIIHTNKWSEMPVKQTS